jgi:lysophosphatidic acid acyltransferase/lysophosphatidylinositol acyltransferase
MLSQLWKAGKALFAVLFVVISGAIVNFLEVLTLLIRPLSRDAFRRINKGLVSLHWPVLVWLIEKWANIEIVVYGDPMPDNETMLGILNHRSDVDWLIGFAMCGRHCALGALKVIVKTGCAARFLLAACKS